MWFADIALMGMLAAAAATDDAAAALPDPTRPYEYSQAVEISEIAMPSAEMQWRLTGIQIRDDMKRAILNGKLVKEGDALGTATVVAIGSSEVTLSHEHRLIVVRLLNPRVKRTAREAGTVESKESK